MIDYPNLHPTVAREVKQLKAELDHSLVASLEVPTFSWRPDKMITGIKSLIIIEDSLRWNKKKLLKKRKKINKTSDFYLANKWQIKLWAKTIKNRKIKNSWINCLNKLWKASKMKRKKCWKRRKRCRKSTKRGLSIRNCWFKNGRRTDSNWVIIKKVWFSKIERKRKLKTKREWMLSWRGR